MTSSVAKKKFLLLFKYSFVMKIRKKNSKRKKFIKKSKRKKFIFFSLFQI